MLRVIISSTFGKTVCANGCLQKLHFACQFVVVSDSQYVDFIGIGSEVSHVGVSDVIVEIVIVGDQHAFDVDAHELEDVRLDHRVVGVVGLTVADQHKDLFREVSRTRLQIVYFCLLKLFFIFDKFDYSKRSLT